MNMAAEMAGAWPASQQLDDESDNLPDSTTDFAVRLFRTRVGRRTVLCQNS